MKAISPLLFIHAISNRKTSRDEANPTKKKESEKKKENQKALATYSSDNTDNTSNLRVYIHTL